MITRKLLQVAAITALAVMVTSPVRAGLTLDPIGDTSGAYDIVSINSTLTTNDLTIEVTFTPSSADPWLVVGFVDIDVDQNPATGTTSTDAGFTASRGAPVPGGLGIEVYI